MVLGNLVSVVAALAFLAAVLSGHLSVPTAIAPMFLYTLGAGMASPMALTEAVSVNPHVVGAASGLYGATQMAIGALCTASRPSAGSSAVDSLGAGGRGCRSASRVLVGARNRRRA